MADLLALASAKLGQTVDMDGMYGGQCMDLIVYVVQTAYGVHMGGNAIDTGSASNIAALQNAGVKVQRITNRSQLQRGDIVVFSDGGYGHVAIIEEPTHPKLVQQNINGRQYVTRDSFAWSDYYGLSFAYGLRLGDSTPNPDPQPEEGEIDMFIIKTVAQGNYKPSYFITDGITVRHIGTARMRKAYEEMGVKTHVMYEDEIVQEYKYSLLVYQNNKVKPVG